MTTTVLAWIGAVSFGAMGSFGRFRIDGAVTARWPTDFPLGTLVVNLTGGFVLGTLVGLSVANDVLFVFGTGLLGGYTTFSTWMVESERLAENGEWGLMWLNLFGSMAAGVAATGLGWLAGDVMP